MGKIAAMIVVWNAEFAQSYITQARTSRRSSPRRVRSSAWQPRVAEETESTENSNARRHGGHGGILLINVLRVLRASVVSIPLPSASSVGLHGGKFFVFIYG